MRGSGEVENTHGALTFPFWANEDDLDDLAEPLVGVKRKLCRNGTGEGLSIFDQLWGNTMMLPLRTDRPGALRDLFSFASIQKHTHLARMVRSNLNIDRSPGSRTTLP